MNSQKGLSWIILLVIFAAVGILVIGAGSKSNKKITPASSSSPKATQTSTKQNQTPNNSPSPITNPKNNISLKRCDAPISYTVFRNDGFGSNWSHVNDLVAYNRKDSDGFYHIFTLRPDGSGETRFGANNPNFPKKTTGSPVWHPSGKYLAFVAEKPNHEDGSNTATPGWGGYSDLWLATSDGSKLWQLTDTPNDKDHGTLIPEFSPDGKLLHWTERTKYPNLLNPPQIAGYWVIKVANFIDDPNNPRLENIRTFSPGGDFFNETGGFSKDSTTLVFSSDYVTKNTFNNQIYKLNLNTEQITPLTTEAYNEHPRFTPDGRILWMSNKDQTPYTTGTDWWIMNSDGLNKKRLSYLNDKNHPNYIGKAVQTGVVPTTNWSEDGSFFLGDVQVNLLTADSQILKVSLTCP